MLNLFRGGKVTSGLSALRSEDSNCKGGDATAGSSSGSSSSSSSRSDSGMYPGDSAVGEAVAAPQLERHHPPVVYTLGTPAPGLDTVVYVIVESSESDMIVTENSK
nr:hypothetical protein [Tanacetum cinerariifolium]